MLNNLILDRNSFWIGFIAGALFMWVAGRLRVMLPAFIRWFRKQAAATQANLSTSTENRLRNDTFNYTQRLHLASSLFALDEIAVEPLVLTPPLNPELDPEGVYVDITSTTIPYMPDWPEMASWYGAPALRLGQALSGGTHLVILGLPGAGKTTALAYLASHISRHDASLGEIKDRVPFFVHAANLFFRAEQKELYEPLLPAFNPYISTLTSARLPEIVRGSLTNGRAVLLLDGLDELPPEQIQKTVAWLAQLLEKYPTLRVVAAASPDNYGGLSALGFTPVPLATWNEYQVIGYIDQWDKLWNQHISPLLPGSSEFIDNLLLSSWLKNRESHLTPFELTLKVWGTFAGDILGNETPGLIESYLRRLTNNIPNSRQALERIAVHLVTNFKATFSHDEARSLISEFETAVTVAPLPEEAPPSDQPAAPKAKEKPSRVNVPSGSQMLSLFTNNGVLLSQGGSQYSFTHPLLVSYLAGRSFAMGGTVTTLVSQPDWSGKWQALGFVGCFGDISELVNALLPKAESDLLHRDLFLMARWLRNAPKALPWRANILRSLANLIQKDYLTLSLATRGICALALSGDPGISTLFRQMLQSPQPNLRQLGALGCGLVCDVKAVGDLESMVEDPVTSVGQAACLALVAIGNKSALDAVVTTLLQGSEYMRKAAAEALVNNREEGLPTLEEGASVDDLLVRRSVVYAYMRINQPKFITTLEKMAVEDAQWVVRNAAANALEILRSPSPHIPHPYPVVTEIPWLISYAGKQGMGVQPGKPAYDLVLRAVENGDEQEKLIALEYLRLHGTDYSIHRLYNAYYGSLESIREAAFNTIWHIAASGTALPPPAQFGLGKI